MRKLTRIAKKREEGLVYHDNLHPRGAHRFSFSAGTPHLFAKTPVYTEHHQLHKAPHQPVVERLLAGEYAILYTVQLLKQQIRYDEYRRIARQHPVKHPHIGKRDKQRRNDYLRRHIGNQPDVEIAEYVTACLCARFHTLYQRAHAEFLPHSVGNRAHLFQRIGFQLKIYAVPQALVRMIVQICACLGLQQKQRIQRQQPWLHISDGKSVQYPLQHPYPAGSAQISHYAENYVPPDVLFMIGINATYKFQHESP